MGVLIFFFSLQIEHIYAMVWNCGVLWDVSRAYSILLNSEKSQNIFSIILTSFLSFYMRCIFMHSYEVFNKFTFLMVLNNKFDHKQIWKKTRDLSVQTHFSSTKSTLHCCLLNNSFGHTVSWTMFIHLILN